MLSPPPPEMEKDWLDPVFIIRTLFSHAWLLIIGPIIFGVLIAAYTLTIPNTFESNTAMIVREPQIPVTGETSPLSIEMLQALVESAQIKHTAYKSLVDSGQLSEDVDFRAFQRMLATKVDKKVGRDLSLLPMVRLSAQADDPDLAAAIANRWADMATSQTNQIYAGDVETLRGFAGAISLQADQELGAAETTYTATVLKSDVMVTSSALQAQWSQHAALYAKLLDLQDQISSSTAVLTNTQDRLTSQQIDGMWVGDFASEALREQRLDDLAEAAARAPHVLRVVQDIEKGEKALADFEIHSEIQYKDMLLRNKEEQLKQIAQAIVESQDQLAKSETQYMALKGELQKVPQKISLDKAITDDALWQAYMRGELNAKQFTPLKSEESNPVYEKTSGDVIALSGEVKGQQSRVKYYQERTEQLKDEVSGLAQQLSGLTNEKQNRMDAIAKDKDLLKFFIADYNSARQVQKTLVNAIAELNAELKSTSGTLAALNQQIKGNEKSYFTNQAFLGALERDVENRKQVQASLASKAAEVALLKVSSQQASRSGTVILYRAEANPVRISPKRTYTVLGSMAGCFFLLGFALVLRAGPLAGLGTPQKN